MSGDHNMYQKPRSYDDDTQYDEAQVQAMIDKAVRDEREACAKVCADIAMHREMDSYGMLVAHSCANEILARGGKLT
jgi:hypothetical protein